MSFAQVVPGYAAFSRLLWADLAYQGTVIYICPNSTTPADVRQIYGQIHLTRPDVGYGWCSKVGLPQLVTVRRPSRA
ncbi:MAG: hypothetical protein KDJ65_01950 [Anaerolineae bacterium]|nr:hypothetical protein [Anaerolineae bacterium]